MAFGYMTELPSFFLHLIASDLQKKVQSQVILAI